MAWRIQHGLTVCVCLCNQDQLSFIVRTRHNFTVPAAYSPPEHLPVCSSKRPSKKQIDKPIWRSCIMGRLRRHWTWPISSYRDDVVIRCGSCRSAQGHGWARESWGTSSLRPRVLGRHVTLPIDSPHDPRALPGAVPGPEMQDQALGAGFAFDLGVCS